ncbi:hypothetical protein GCM10029964_044820 [Kibdelosporangium lantanae]
MRQLIEVGRPLGFHEAPGSEERRRHACAPDELLTLVMPSLRRREYSLVLRAATEAGMRELGLHVGQDHLLAAL